MSTFTTWSFLLAFILSAPLASGEPHVAAARKLGQVEMPASSWDEQVTALTSMKNRFLCSVSALKHLTGPAFTYEGSICKVGQATCTRTGQGDETRLVTMSKSSVVYMGCYQGSDTPLADAILKELAGTNKPSACMSACLGLGRPFAGLKNGAECHCGQSRPRPDRHYNRAAENVCDMPCPGEDSVMCGGSDATNVYWTDLSTATAGALYWPMTSGEKLRWQLQGTVTGVNVLAKLRDGNLGTFFGPSNLARPWMQIELPSSQLVKGIKISGTHTWRRHSYFEVRVGDTDAGSTLIQGDRICANRLCYTTGEDFHSVKSLDCSKPAPGKFITVQKYSAQGHSSHVIQIYEVEVILFCDDSPLEECDVRDVEPEDACDTADDYVEGAVIYLGCFTDDAAGRTMLADHVHQGTTLLPLRCAEACWIEGYTYSGVENDEMCFCDQNPPHFSKKADEAECNVDCVEDASFKCGGNLRLSIYHTPLLFQMTRTISAVGCYDLAALDIHLGKPHPTKNFRSICATSCFSLGYIYSATGGADGQECSCSAAEPDASAKLSKKVNYEDCDSPCPGNANHRCGGDGKISIHRVSAADSDHAPGHTLDGAWDTFFLSYEGEKYPWFQVDFGGSTMVKGVLLVPRLDCCNWQYSSLEVRVGDVDVSTRSKGRRMICANRLCYTTGNSQAAFNSFLCATPLRGRYLTVQKYADSFDPGTLTWSWGLSLTAIEIYN